MVRTWRKMAVATLLAGVAGCQLMALAGKGKQPALYTFPKGARVLVFVDIRPEVAAPPAFESTMGDQLAAQLYQNKAADKFVPQEQLLLLEHDPEKFAKMGVADIAEATGADVVLVVYVVYLNVVSTIDNAVTQGAAQVYVKVVDRKGERLWPGDATGTKVEATVDPTLLSDRDKTGVYTVLSHLLVRRTGRMFHEYSLDDKDMTH